MVCVFSENVEGQDRMSLFSDVRLNSRAPFVPKSASRFYLARQENANAPSYFL